MRLLDQRTGLQQHSFRKHGTESTKEKQLRRTDQKTSPNKPRKSEVIGQRQIDQTDVSS